MKEIIKNVSNWKEKRLLANKYKYLLNITKYIRQFVINI